MLFVILCSFKSSNVIVLKHSYYTIYFDKELKQPLYTVYTLTDKESSNNSYHRTSFKPDPLVKTAMQGSSTDYSRSGFDKGHFSPSDDFRFNEKAQKESMYYTNCAPQNPTLNRGLWKSIETRCRKLSIKYKKVKITTGCTYSDSKQFIKKLKVPTHFWKLLEYNGIREAYLVKNVSVETNDGYTRYQVEPKTIDSILKTY